jgi:hypothetical protein
LELSQPLIFCKPILEPLVAGWFFLNTINSYKVKFDVVPELHTSYGNYFALLAIFSNVTVEETEYRLGTV